MSHYSLVKVKIRNPNVELLKKTVKQIAGVLGGEVVAEIRDYYGRVRGDFLIGIRTPNIPRGVGVQVDVDGYVKIVADLYCVKHEVDRFQKMLTQYYTANALATSLKAIGYQSTMQRVRDKVIVKAVAV